MRGRAASALFCAVLLVTGAVAPVAGGGPHPGDGATGQRTVQESASEERPNRFERKATPAGTVRRAAVNATNASGANDTSTIGTSIHRTNETPNGTDADADASRVVVETTTATEAIPPGVWANLFRDAGQTGVTPRADAPTTAPRIRWSRTLSGPPSGLVATDGRLYLNVADDSLAAIDRRSGTVDWSNGSGVQGFAPVVADDVVVTYPLQGGFLFARQNLTAYDATSGRRAWAITPEDADTFITAPVVADGVIYLGYDRRVTAYDADTGQPGWKTQLGDQPRAPLLVRHGHVYVRERNGNFSALDRTDGSVAWRTSLDTTGFGAQAATERAVYAVNGTAVVAFDPADGSRNWSVGGFARTGALAAGNETLYVSVDTGNETGVVALDAETGEQRWFQSRTGLTFHDVGRMTATDDTLYVAASDGTLYALDRTDGTERWAWTPSGSPGTPTPINDSLYVTAGNTVYALEDRPVDGNLTVNPAPPTVNTTTELNASSVVQSLGGPTQVRRVEWSFGDGDNATGVRVFHRFDDSGTYDVTATVTTNDGFRVPITQSVTVVDPNVSEPRFTLVAASPPGQVPGHPIVTKNYTVGVVAPSSVERVAFEVRKDGETVETLVDRNGSDGWTAAVPTTYGPDSVVRLRAVTASGETVTRTLDIGVVRFGPFVEYILNNGEVEFISGGRYVVGVVLPPTGRIAYEQDLQGLGTLELALLGQATFGGRFDPPRSTLSGQLEYEVVTPNARIAGKGAVTGIDREQDLNELEFERVVGSFEGEGGGYIERDLPVESEGLEVSLVVFYGGYLSGKNVVWRNGTLWPPTNGTASVGLTTSGSLSATVGKGLFEIFALEGTATGRAGIESTFPRLTENVSLAGEAKVQGRVIFVFATVSFERTLFKAGLEVTDASALEAQSTTRTRLRRKVGEVPPSTESPTPAALDASASGGAGTQTGRLTRNRYADGSPSVAGTPEGFLLAWDRQPAAKTVLDGHEITVRRYTDGGFGSPTNLTDDRRMDLDPAVASGVDGSRLVAWTRLNRTFTNASSVDPQDSFGATRVAIATRNGSDSRWSAPRMISGNDGAAFSPRVAYGAGRYVIAWRVDADGNFTTADDQRIRYVTYEPDTGSVGPVRTVADARQPRVAGNETTLRLVGFRPTNASSDDGQLVVRDLSDGTERTVSVENLVDIAVTAGSVTWLRGPANNRSLEYVADVRTGRIDTAPVAAPTDIGAVTRETASGRMVTVLTFRGRTTGGNRTSKPAVFHRARLGGNWTRARRVSPRTASLTFGQAATGGGQDGFLTAFLGRNVSADEQLNDVFFARHTYGAALNLSARVNASVEPGNSTTVHYAIINEGTRIAQNVTVVVEDGSTTVEQAPVRPLDPGERATGTVTVDAPQDGTLGIRAATSTPTLPGSNDTVSLVTSRPELSISDISKRPGATNVTYAVTVANDGDAPAGPTAVAVTNYRRTVATTALAELAPGENRTTTLTVSVAELNRYRPTRIHVDPDDRITEFNETNGVRVVTTTLPELFVVSESTRVDADRGTAEVTVGNRGPGAATVTVGVSTGNRTVRRRTTIDGSPSGDAVTTSVRVPVGNLSLSANESVLVRVRPDAPETNTTDNLVEVPVSSDSESGVNATLITTVNNVGSSAELVVDTSGLPGNITSLSVERPDGTSVSLPESCLSTDSEPCTVTPTASTWADGEYQEVEYVVRVTDATGNTTTDTASTAVYIAGDATGDGRVNIFDAVAIGRAWQTSRGDAGYSDAADLTNDGRVNIFDAVSVGRNWLATAS